jgi:serine/threonine protein kinase
MTPDRWAQIKEIFGAAQERPEYQRAVWLDSACGADVLLRGEVERLLAQDEGSLLSHYRIEAKLGQGGMGAVCQAYDSRLRRQVALKVLSPKHLADLESRILDGLEPPHSLWARLFQR